jgi:hypothetical protein
MTLRRIAPVAVLVLSVTATSALLASGGEESGHGKLTPQATDAKWKTECSACHVGYPPALLPARSWERIMAGLADHFGEDAALDAASAREISEYLVRESADRGARRAGRKIANAIAAAEAPLRITETRWFRHKHDEIAPAVWRRAAVASPANCGACHKNAAEGDYSERRVAIPRDAGGSAPGQASLGAR